MEIEGSQVLPHMKAKADQDSSSGLMIRLDVLFEDPVAFEVDHHLGQDVRRSQVDEGPRGMDPLLLCDEGPHVVSSAGPSLGHVSVMLPVGTSKDVAGLSPNRNTEIISSSIFNLENVKFGDESMKAELAPPAGFLWRFSAGVWVLYPSIVDSLGGSVASNKEPVQVDMLEVDKIPSDGDNCPSDIDVVSDDSVTEFERNLRELLPDLKESSSSGGLATPRGSRGSERQKRPSTRFNEESGFVPEPPRSTKKKMPLEESTEGMISNPYLITDWTNV